MNNGKIEIKHLPQSEAIIEELLNYKPRKDTINIFSVLGGRGYGKSTILDSLYNKKSNDILNNKYKILPIITPDLLETDEIIGWIIAFFDKEVERLKRKWDCMSICDKDKILSQLKNGLCDETLSKEIYEISNLNNRYRFALIKYYNDVIENYYKRDDSFKTVIQDKFHDNKEYKSEIKDILKSDIDFKTSFDKFVKCFVHMYKEVNQCKETIKILLLIDDLDLHIENAYSIFNSLVNQINNEHIVMLLSGDYDEFYISVHKNIVKSHKNIGTNIKAEQENVYIPSYYDHLTTKVLDKVLPVNRRFYLEKIEDIYNFFPITNSQTNNENDKLGDLLYKYILGESNLSEASEAETDIGIDEDTIKILLTCFNPTPRVLVSLYDLLSKKKSENLMNLSKLLLKPKSKNVYGVYKKYILESKIATNHDKSNNEVDKKNIGNIKFDIEKNIKILNVDLRNGDDSYYHFEKEIIGYCDLMLQILLIYIVKYAHIDYQTNEDKSHTYDSSKIEIIKAILETCSGIVNMFDKNAKRKLPERLKVNNDNIHSVLACYIKNYRHIIDPNNDKTDDRELKKLANYTYDSIWYSTINYSVTNSNEVNAYMTILKKYNYTKKIGLESIIYEVDNIISNVDENSKMPKNYMENMKNVFNVIIDLDSIKRVEFDNTIHIVEFTDSDADNLLKLMYKDYISSHDLKEIKNLFSRDYEEIKKEDLKKNYSNLLNDDRLKLSKFLNVLFDKIESENAYNALLKRRENIETEFSKLDNLFSNVSDLFVSFDRYIGGFMDETIKRYELTKRLKSRGSNHIYSKIYKILEKVCDDYSIIKLNRELIIDQNNKLNQDVVSKYEHISSSLNEIKNRVIKLSNNMILLNKSGIYSDYQANNISKIIEKNIKFNEDIELIEKTDISRFNTYKKEMNGLDFLYDESHFEENYNVTLEDYINQNLLDEGIDILDENTDIYKNMIKYDIYPQTRDYFIRVVKKAIDEYDIYKENLLKYISYMYMNKSLKYNNEKSTLLKELSNFSNCDYYLIKSYEFVEENFMNFLVLESQLGRGEIESVKYIGQRLFENFDEAIPRSVYEENIHLLEKSISNRSAVVQDILDNFSKVEFEMIEYDKSYFDSISKIIALLKKEQEIVVEKKSNADQVS